MLEWQLEGAFREGLVKGFNEFSKSKFEGDDIREGMAGAISVRLKEPVFESQTKNKLGNTEIRSELVNQVRQDGPELTDLVSVACRQDDPPHAPTPATPATSPSAAI